MSKTGMLWKDENNINRIKKLKLKPNQKLGGAIPTRNWSKIFAIGLPKTCNHTLDTLFRTNGLESMHHKIGTAKGKIAMEQVKNGHYNLEILKEIDVLIDTLARLYYMEFSAYYRDALYIYMIRERSDWLDSMKRHWANTDDKRVRLAHNNGFVKTAEYAVWKFSQLRFNNHLNNHHIKVMSFFNMHKSNKTSRFVFDYDKLVEYVAKRGYLINPDKNLLIINIANGDDKKTVKILSKFTGLDIKQKEAPDVFYNKKNPRKETLKL